MLPRKSEAVTTSCCHSREACSTTRPRRGWELTAGALSLGVWAVMPKCPLCLAAHLTLWTGLGLSFSEAAYLRGSLLLLSGAALVYLLIKLLPLNRKAGAVAEP